MIYICIPAHNEERTIGVLLWKVRSVMAEFRRDYQILVLDDASTDGTQRVLDPYARIMPLTVIRHQTRRGYAASLETLLREAARRSPYPRRDAIVTMQGDFTEDPGDIPLLIKRVEAGADVVTSRARFNGMPIPGGVRWSRGALGYLARRFPWPEGVSDPLSGFRAYRVIAVRKALETGNSGRLLRHDGLAANVELLRAVSPYARRIDETEIDLHYGRRQRASRFRAWGSALQLMRALTGRAGPDTEALEYDGAPAASQPEKPRRNGGGRRRGGRRKTPKAPRAASAAASDIVAGAAPAGTAAEPSGDGEQGDGDGRPRRPASQKRRRRRGGRGRKPGDRQPPSQGEAPPSQGAQPSSQGEA